MKNTTDNKPERESDLIPEVTVIKRPKQNGLKIVMLALIPLLAIAIFYTGLNLKDNNSGRQDDNKRTVMPVSNGSEDKTTSVPAPIIKGNFPEVIKDTEIYYLGNQGLGIYRSKLNMPPVKIGDGSYLKVSPDHKKVAYVGTEQEPAVYVYDVTTEQTEKLSTNIKRVRAVEWSPKGDYLIINSGTDVTGQDWIYTYPKPRLIVNYALVGTTRGWLNNNDYVYTEPTVVTPAIPAGNGTSSSIVKKSLAAKTKVLKEGTSYKAYSLIGTNRGYIYYAEENWTENYSDVSTKYWVMDYEGNNESEISMVEAHPKTMSLNLPGMYKDYVVREVKTNPLKPDWAIVSLLDSTRTSQVSAIVNLYDSINTFTILQKNISW